MSDPNPKSPAKLNGCSWGKESPLSPSFQGLSNLALRQKQGAHMAKAIFLDFEVMHLIERSKGNPRSVQQHVTEEDREMGAL